MGIVALYHEFVSDEGKALYRPCIYEKMMTFMDRCNIFCTFGRMLQIVREKIFLTVFLFCFWPKIPQIH
jgi:hypothetical protein